MAFIFLPLCLVFGCRGSPAIGAAQARQGMASRQTHLVGGEWSGMWPSQDQTQPGGLSPKHVSEAVPAMDLGVQREKAQFV